MVVFGFSVDDGAFADDVCLMVVFGFSVGVGLCVGVGFGVVGGFCVAGGFWSFGAFGSCCELGSFAGGFGSCGGLGSFGGALGGLGSLGGALGGFGLPVSLGLPVPFPMPGGILSLPPGSRPGPTKLKMSKTFCISEGTSAVLPHGFNQLVNASSAALPESKAYLAN